MVCSALQSDSCDRKGCHTVGLVLVCRVSVPGSMVIANGRVATFAAPRRFKCLDAQVVSHLLQRHFADSWQLPGTAVNCCCCCCCL
jgi:hypothetical protein